MKNIPNILTVLRLCCVPAFVLVFFTISPICSMGFFLLAGLTDILDGYLARKNNWITPLGKILDPMADKLMQCAVLICFCIIGYINVWLAAPFILKELAQAVLGTAMFKRRHVLTVSFWYGKAAVSLFYFAVTATVILHRFNLFAENIDTIVLIMWVFTLAWMLFAFTSYLVCYAMMAAKMKKEWKENAQEGNK